MPHMLMIGLSHRTAPVATRERAHRNGESLTDALQRWVQHPCIDEAAMLSTCNRVEVIVMTSDVEAAHAVVLAQIAESCDLTPAALMEYTYAYVGLAAVYHVMRVAAGLDSLVLGETQILGQLADALNAARAAKTSGASLNLLLTAALHTGKRVRAETRIAHGARSVASIAARTALHAVAGQPNPIILIVGAGEMGQAAARALQGREARVILLNRTDSRASAAAALLHIDSHPWANLTAALISADAVIAATGAQSAVLTTDALTNVMTARRGRRLTIVDLAVPRAVEAGAVTLPGLTLHDIDALRAHLDQSSTARQAEAARAERLCIAAARVAQRRLSERGAVPAIIALRHHEKHIAQAEYDAALRRQPDLTPEAQAAMSRTIRRAHNQTLYPQTLALKAHAVRINADTVPIRLTPPAETSDD